MEKDKRLHRYYELNILITMKKKLFTLLLAVAASVGIILASNTQVDGIWYNFNSTNKTAEVTYRGSSSTAYSNEYAGVVTIPASVTYSGTTYSVTSIGDYAFYECSSLTSVMIPNSVTSIGDYAFYGCTGLTSVTIPNSVTNIGDRAFSGCSGLTSVAIPESVISIGNLAFADCNGLTSPVYNTHVFAYMPTSYSGAYTIPDGIESVASNAFRNCSGLTYVTIPNSVTSIGEGAFDGCSGLPINDNCRYADTYLVEAVDKTLSTYTIKDGTRFIGSYAFSHCSNLTSIEIPNSVTSIGHSAFWDCTGLTSIEIPNSVTSIGGSAFYKCSGLISVTIPNSVTSIEDQAFVGCTGLTSPVYNAHVFAFMPTSYSGVYTIPDGIESIAGYAFGGCTGLTSVTIPNSVTSIGSGAFNECTGLTSVTIPNSVTSIGWNAFYDCSNLTSVTIPNSVTSIGAGAFWACSGLTTVTIPNSVISIGQSAFYGCSGLTSVTIPNSVTSIGSFAFSGCSGLTSIEIPNSVTSIGGYAFQNCSGLTSPVYNAHVFAYMPTSYSGAYTIPDGIESIAGYAFSGCSGLTTVTIPSSVTSIGGSAFSGCTGLTSITIPNSVTSIGSFAFSGCSGLASVTIEAKTPPALGDYAFGFGFDIYVPCGTLEAYKTAWADYADRIRLGVEYTITGKVNDANAGSVDYPTSSCGDVVITAVPNNGYHFTQWSDGNTNNPRTFVLTQDTTFTAEFAYDRVGTCGKDLALVWSYDPTNKVLTIGNAGEFTENMQFGAEAPNEMEELVIGNSVTAIGANAFAGISTLKKVSIGESVKTIGEQAFYNCVNLETIFNYRPTPTNTYSNAFDGVDKFECTLYVLPNSIDMYKAAAVWRDFYYTYAIGAEEATVTTNDVQVEPQDNAATLTWPTSNNAASYTIQITKDGVVFCTLIFNANGQLTGIAFAPSRDGQAHAPAAIMTANGLQFTVTGLDSNTQYGYSVTAKDANDQLVATYSGEFTTTSEGEATGVEEISSSLQGGDRGRLILRNGQIFILRGEKVYTLTGQETIVP